MKRLFRTSKAGTVDPLPPPAPQPMPSAPTLHQHQQHQQQQAAGRPTGKKTMANMFGGHSEGNGDGHGHGHGQDRSGGHHHHHHHSESKPRQGNVTPFPLDVGRDAPPPPGATSAQHAQVVKSKGREKSSSISSPPSLLELQRMQAQSDQPAEYDSRRDEWLASQQKQHRQATPPTGYQHHSVQAQPPLHPIVPPPRQGRAYDNATSPDGRANVNPPGGSLPPHAQAPGQSPSNASTPTIQQSQLYLPPGARPPSPQVRPDTPTRPSYPSSLGHHSQSSLQYAEIDPYTTNSAPRVGRDRGYSSASGSMRDSDHESSTHGHLAQHQAPSPLPQKMPIPKPGQPLASRSPLSHTYATPISPDPINIYSSNPPPPLKYSVPSQQDYAPMVQEMSAIRIEGPSPETEIPREAGGRDKEKKKFWGMDWGKRDKEREKEKLGRKEQERRSIDEPRRSGERYRGEDKSSTGHGHSTEEEGGHKGRVLGLDIGGRLWDSHNQSPAQGDSVTAAIQILCAHPHPPFSSTYEISERINHSSNSESVGKEAAQALRKQLKYGSDAEKRSAANMWLLMMRNVHAKGFRSHATGRKFMAVIEALLLAPPNKRIVTSSTHQAIASILGDVTYHFGGDKGSEALVELWKKVKLPQESDTGTPLPADFQAFQPGTFYASPPPGSFDTNGYPSAHSSHTTGSRRPSSPNGGMLGISSVPAPVPHRGHSPLHMSGPGYAHLPNHSDDVRRLVDECTAAREAARVLAEALVFTRPHELEQKPIIGEFYRKCFLAHESLTNQIDWAQAEANQSRERAFFEASMNGLDDVQGLTMEEQALGALFEAHSALGEALKQHDDMERMAVDDMEMREARERSKKETKMDRNGYESSNLLAPDFNAGGSSSRSPSPVRHARLPPPDHSYVSSPQPIHNTALPVPRPYQADSRSRTPSPDQLPPRITNSPSRASSPLGQSVLVKAKGPRPLPNPFSRTQNASTQSLSSAQKDSIPHHSRSGTENSHDNPVEGAAEDDEELQPPAKPSRKALGKRRAVEDVDNNFDPNDMFGVPKRPSSESSHESVTADDVYNTTPVVYAYDAYQEKLKQELQVERVRTSTRPNDPVLGGGGGGSGSAMMSNEIEAR